MCAQFEQSIERIKNWKAALDAYKSILEILKTSQISGIILPYQPATVLTRQGPQAMSFSLVPQWSKESKVKWATHNARIESIDEKASFKEAFVKRHCIIPMTGFIEPIYIGSHAGNMVEFFPQEDVLLSAGIHESWHCPKSGEVLDSFTIVTTEPLPFVEKIGHDRSPIFLSIDDARAWLTNENESPLQLKNFLLQKKVEPLLDVEIHRPMKAGWQKRIPKD